MSTVKRQPDTQCYGLIDPTHGINNKKLVRRQSPAMINGNNDERDEDDVDVQ